MIKPAILVSNDNIYCLRIKIQEIHNAGLASQVSPAAEEKKPKAPEISSAMPSPLSPACACVSKQACVNANRYKPMLVILKMLRPRYFFNQLILGDWSKIMF